MNRVGIYYAFWEREWAADFRPYVKKVKALGFDTLEIAAGALPDMTAADRRALRDEAEAEGIQLTCCMGLDPAHDVSSADEAVRREGIRYVGEVLDCIHEIGSHVFSGINYAYWPMQGAPDYDGKMGRAGAFSALAAGDSRPGGAVRHRLLPRDCQPLRAVHP